jgi:hypothetical protein
MGLLLGLEVDSFRPDLVWPFDWSNGRACGAGKDSLNLQPIKAIIAQDLVTNYPPKSA